MEFGRWGFKKISQISDRYRGLKEFLAEVLEGERKLLEPAAHGSTESSEPHFQVRDDLSTTFLSTFSSTTGPRRLARMRTNERVSLVFSSLAPYFESGFLLREAESDSADLAVLEMMFLYGKVFVPSKHETPKVDLALPDFADRGVFRGRIAPILKTFRLNGVSHLSEASAFAFSPSPGHVFILLCSRPHPWQVGIVESAVDTVNGLLGQGARA